MKEYLITFEKEGEQYLIRRYLSPKMAANTMIWAQQKMTDNNGVTIIDCEEVVGVNPSSFIPSIL